VGLATTRLGWPDHRWPPPGPRLPSHTRRPGGARATTVTHRATVPAARRAPAREPRPRAAWARIPAV